MQCRCRAHGVSGLPVDAKKCVRAARAAGRRGTCSPAGNSDSLRCPRRPAAQTTFPYSRSPPEATPPRACCRSAVRHFLLIFLLLGICRGLGCAQRPSTVSGTAAAMFAHYVFVADGGKVCSESARIITTDRLESWPVPRRREEFGRRDGNRYPGSSCARVKGYRCERVVSAGHRRDISGCLRAGSPPSPRRAWRK